MNVANSKTSVWPTNKQIKINVTSHTHRPLTLTLTQYKNIHFTLLKLIGQMKTQHCHPQLQQHSNLFSFDCRRKWFNKSTISHKTNHCNSLAWNIFVSCLLVDWSTTPYYLFFLIFPTDPYGHMARNWSMNWINTLHWAEQNKWWREILYWPLTFVCAYFTFCLGDDDDYALFWLPFGHLNGHWQRSNRLSKEVLTSAYRTMCQS